jgi:hypothetical protein
VTTTKAFDRFTQSTPSTPVLTFSEGNLVAVVSTVGLSWSWVVWDGPAIVGGEKSWEMDAMQACEDALTCLESAKTRFKTTVDEFFSTKEI